MSKWDKEYILLVQDLGTKAKDKNVISDSAMDYVHYCEIPIERRFSTRNRETSKRSKFDLRPFNFKGAFSPLSLTSLAPLTIRDKLYVFAHADPNEVGFTGPKTMAGLLVCHGLKNVGLVTFKACNVGTGNFLESFVVSMVSQGVVMGWAKGYRGSAATVYDDAGRPAELIERPKKHRDGTTSDVEVTGDRRFKVVSSPNNPYASGAGRYQVA